MVGRGVLAPGAVFLLSVLTTACGGQGERDVFDAVNSRETGPFLSVGRVQGGDGSLVVHVVAHHPEHARTIAGHIVHQNYATSAVPIRVIVDPSGATGERRVYRWDGQTLDADQSTEGLPPAPTRLRERGH